MVTENQILTLSRKNRGSVLFSSNFKLKRIFCVLEFNPCGCYRKAKVCKRIDREDSCLWDLEPFVVGVDYFEEKIIKGEGVVHKCEIFGDGAWRFDIVIVLPCIDKWESDGGEVLFSSGDSITRPCIDEANQEGDK